MAYTYAGNLKKKITSGSGNKVVYEKTIAGTSVSENPIPENTASNREDPFLVLEDPCTGKRIGISKKRLSLGLLALASAGGGKTNLFRMIMDALLDSMGDQDVLIVFDTKGDYYRAFADRIPEKNRVIVGTGEEYAAVTFYPNFFAEIMPKGKDEHLVYTPEVDENVREIAGQMFSQLQSESQPVFPEMAKQIVEVLIVYMIRTYWKTDPSKLNNKELAELVKRTNAGDIQSILELEYMTDYRSCISYVSAKGGRMGQGVMAYVSTAMRRLLVGSFAKADPDREFSMREIITGQEKKVVFIEYDLIRGESLAPMYGIELDQGLKYALGGRNTERKNVYVLLDEYILLPKMEYTARALSFGRSQNVKIIAGVQNIKALENIYGEAEAKNLLSGFQNMFAFKMSDHDTRQYVMDRMGANYKDISYSSQGENIHIQRQTYTVEEWELQNLGLCKGQAVIELAGERPFLFQIPKYEGEF